MQRLTDLAARGMASVPAAELGSLAESRRSAMLHTTTGTRGMRLAELLRLDIEQNELSEDEWFRRGHVRRSNV